MLEITIPARALKEVLVGLAKVITRKCTLPILGYVRIDTAEGRVSFSATNLEQFVTANVPEASAGETGSTGSILVPLTFLQEISRRLRSELILSPGQARHRIGETEVTEMFTPATLEEYPAVPDVRGSLFPVPDTFGEHLRQAFSCASNDPGRYILNGACLDVSAKDAHYLVGTDGKMLYSANGLQVPLTENAVIPLCRFLQWPGFEGPWQIGVAVIEGHPWMRLDGGRWSCITRLIEGTYPNWRQVVPSLTDDGTTIEFEDPVGTSRLISSLPGRDDAHRRVALVKNGASFVLKARGKEDANWTETPLQTVKVSGSDVEVHLDREFLVRALSVGTLCMEVVDARTPVTFSGNGKQVVVMPLVNEDTPPSSKPAPSESTPVTQQPDTTLPAQPDQTNRKNQANQQPSSTEPANGQTHGRAAGHDRPDADPLEAALNCVEQFRTELRSGLTRLNEMASSLREAQRERRAGRKEMESVRTALGQLQKVRL